MVQQRSVKAKIAGPIPAARAQVIYNNYEELMEDDETPDERMGQIGREGNPMVGNTRVYFGPHPAFLNSFARRPICGIGQSNVNINYWPIA